MADLEQVQEEGRKIGAVLDLSPDEQARMGPAAIAIAEEGLP